MYNEVHWRSGVRSGSGGGVSSVSDRLACHRLYINTIMTQILQLTLDTRVGEGAGGTRGTGLTTMLRRPFCIELERSGKMEVSRSGIRIRSLRE
jgi:hypothetical protein